jgi:hypothetical protein
MGNVRIDCREYPMYRPLPTDKLSRGVMLLAWEEGASLVWRQSYKNPNDATLKADSLFLEANKAPFCTDGRQGGYRVMSWHHGAVDLGDRNIIVQVPNHRDPFYILRAPDQSVPLWVDPIISAYQHKIDEMNEIATPYRERKKRLPAGVKAKLTKLQWRKDLFTAHSISGELAFDEHHPQWESHARRVAYAFYDEPVRFQPELPEDQARERNMLEALKRMHGNILALAR